MRDTDQHQRSSTRRTSVDTFRPRVRQYMHHLAKCTKHVCVAGPCSSDLVQRKILESSQVVVMVSDGLRGAGTIQAPETEHC